MPLGISYAGDMIAFDAPRGQLPPAGTNGSAPGTRGTQRDCHCQAGNIHRQEVGEDMASIHREVQLEVSADQAWSVLREVGKPHEAFAGVLTDATIEGDVRTVTFANGMV